MLFFPFSITRYTLLTASGCGNLSAFSFQPNYCHMSKALLNKTLTFAPRHQSSSIQPRVLLAGYSCATSQKSTLFKSLSQLSLSPSRTTQGVKTLISSKFRAQLGLKRPSKAKRQCFRRKSLALKSKWADSSRQSWLGPYADKTLAAPPKTTMQVKVSSPIHSSRQIVYPTLWFLTLGSVLLS